MRIDLAYGSESRSLIVPAGVDVDYITPREITGFEDTSEALDRACSEAVGHTVDGLQVYVTNLPYEPSFRICCSIGLKYNVVLSAASIRPVD